MSETPHIDDKLVETLQAVVHDVESLLKTNGHQPQNGLEQLRTRASEALRAVNATLASAKHNGLRDASAVAAKAEDYTRGNPWRALSAAAAAGIAIGLLLRRR